MRSLSILAAISACSGIAHSLPWNWLPYHGWQSGKGGHDGQSESQWEASQRAAAVKQAFQTAWDGYYKYAFPNDELHPVNNTFGNSRFVIFLARVSIARTRLTQIRSNGWGASALDALSTALIMGNPTIVNEILDHIPSIDWSVSYEDEPVSLFETTIRYVGGLLSGYDLLKGPLAYLCHDSSKVDVLLEQAVNLANNLSYAFDTPTGIPYNNLFFGNRSNDGATNNGLATIGTLVLEWTHLSDLSGNPTYAALTQKAESYLLDPQPATSEPWPGLLGSSVNISNGLFIDAYGGWAGGNDSFYEYLIKMYVYDSSRFGGYKDRWVLAADSSIAHLASHPSSRPDLTFLAEFNGTNLTLESGHLACFDGGNFILGGLVLRQQEYIDFGLALVAGCEDTYNSTLTGIGPEQFSWDASSVPSNQSVFYERAGFYIEDAQYILRPEVIESFYYAYRATGKRVYQDWAWNAFLAITKTTRVGSGYSEITDVNAPAGGNFTNFQDSFLFAEVLKYSYLIHAPDAEWQVNHNGRNEWVFNTEAHPFKVAGTAI